MIISRWPSGLRQKSLAGTIMLYKFKNSDYFHPSLVVQWVKASDLFLLSFVREFESRLFLLLFRDLTLTSLGYILSFIHHQIDYKWNFLFKSIFEEFLKSIWGTFSWVRIGLSVNSWYWFAKSSSGTTNFNPLAPLGNTKELFLLFQKFCHKIFQVCCPWFYRKFPQWAANHGTYSGFLISDLSQRVDLTVNKI